MKYHEVVERIKGLLEENNCWFETFKHEPVRTSEEAAKTRTGYVLKQGAKTIILRVRGNGGKKYFLMLVIPGDKRFDSGKVKKVLNAKNISFATEEEVIFLTGGVSPGGVPPFGNLFGLRVIADKGIFLNEKIVFNAGDRRFSVAMKSADFMALIKPDIESIV